MLGISSSQLIFIFFRGVGTTNQIETSLILENCRCPEQLESASPLKTIVPPTLPRLT